MEGWGGTKLTTGLPGWGQCPGGGYSLWAWGRIQEEEQVLLMGFKSIQALLIIRHLFFPSIKLNIQHLVAVAIGSSPHLGSAWATCVQALSSPWQFIKGD